METQSCLPGAPCGLEGTDWGQSCSLAPHPPRSSWTAHQCLDQAASTVTTFNSGLMVVALLALPVSASARAHP